MLNEQSLIAGIFSNQLLFCCLFGGLGGLVNCLDQHSKYSFSVIISKIVVSTSVGMLMFFMTYDITILSPAVRLSTSMIAGFYGSQIYRLAMRVYAKKHLGVDLCDRNDNDDNRGYKS